MSSDSRLYKAVVADWKRCLRSGSPYIFPRDRILQNRRVRRKLTVAVPDFATFVRSRAFDQRKDSKLHLGLIPRPYAGNLNRAKVFILMLNAGLNPGDYFGEELPSFSKAAARNLRQQNRTDKYPFFLLNPKFSWHPGFRYWNSKLYKISEIICKKKHFRMQRALAYLAKRICVVQLVPYHSQVFKLPSKVKNKLESSKAIKRFVSEVLVPKAKNREVLIVVARGRKAWNLPKLENIEVLSQSESRAAHLSLNRQGGRIASFLGFKVKGGRG
jgi:hypothetical protein